MPYRGRWGQFLTLIIHEKGSQGLSLSFPELNLNRGPAKGRVDRAIGDMIRRVDLLIYRSYEGDPL